MMNNDSLASQTLSCVDGHGRTRGKCLAHKTKNNEQQNPPRYGGAHNA